MTGILSLIPVVILNGQSLSDVAFLNGHTPCMILMPPAWTAADLCFLGSNNGINHHYIYDTLGVLVSMITGASHRLILTQTVFAHHVSMKILSGTPAVPVAQADDRTIYLEVWS
jgi:uncharacterized membrane protein YoaT (DUF817 family)